MLKYFLFAVLIAAALSQEEQPGYSVTEMMEMVGLPMNQDFNQLTPDDQMYVWNMMQQHVGKPLTSEEMAVMTVLQNIVAPVAPSNKNDVEATQSSPEGIAAILTMLENLPKEERDATLEALGYSQSPPGSGGKQSSSTTESSTDSSSSKGSQGSSSQSTQNSNSDSTSSNGSQWSKPQSTQNSNSDSTSSNGSQWSKPQPTQSSGSDSSSSTTESKWTTSQTTQNSGSESSGQQQSGAASPGLTESHWTYPSSSSQQSSTGSSNVVWSKPGSLSQTYEEARPSYSPKPVGTGAIPIYQNSKQQVMVGQVQPSSRPAQIVTVQEPKKVYLAATTFKQQQPVVINPSNQYFVQQSRWVSPTQIATVRPNPIVTSYPVASRSPITIPTISTQYPVQGVRPTIIPSSSTNFGSYQYLNTPYRSYQL